MFCNSLQLIVISSYELFKWEYICNFVHIEGIVKFKHLKKNCIRKYRLFFVNAANYSI